MSSDHPLRINPGAPPRVRRMVPGRRALALLAGSTLLVVAPLGRAQLEVSSANTNRLDRRQAGGSVVLQTLGGPVASIAVRSPGAGYTTTPAVTLSSPPSGTTATATATISGGAVTTLTLTNFGSGYILGAPPVVTIAPPTALQPTGGVPATTPQFASAGIAAGSSGPLSLADAQLGTTNFADRYPSTSSNALVLTRSSIGFTFTSGVPRYFLGEEITPPLARSNNTPFTSPLTDPVAKAADILAQARAYWRPSPVRPGETFSSTLLTPTNTTLAAGAVYIPAGTPETFYWSKHAEKVFANQPGQTVVTWVTRLTESNQFRTKQEVFRVSSATNLPIRTIYWTERTFDGPRVAVRDNRITTVNPAYCPGVPQEVPSEVVLPGIDPVDNNDPGVIRKTFWFERIGTEGSLRAYNVEGRLLIEYLGRLRLGSDVYEHLGTEVVEIVRQPTPYLVTVNLGEEIKPHDGDPTLLPAPKLLVNNSKPPYGTTTRPDGSQVFHAEVETGSPNNPENGLPASDDAYNKVIFYWLEEAAYGIRWPKFQDRYWQRWPVGLDQFAHNTVPEEGSTPDTAVQFSSGILPELVFQDDASQTESRIDLNTQRLLVNVPGDGRNRSLLKFTANGKVWYVRLYTQSPTRADGSPYEEGNGDPSQFNATALVGSRINPPPDFIPPGGGEIVRYEPGGFIAKGSCYHPGAYVNPIQEGIEAAAGGAIIPVNTIPSNELQIWWFRKIVPPSEDFPPLYLPAKVGKYTVSYPAATIPQIVIAQGVGTGDLPPEVAAGSVYYQNDSTQPGYNPNEEHALLIGTRAYALRDDLNMITPQQSQPFVLLSYFDPADFRPAMKVYKVSRELDLDGDRADPGDIIFRYTATAGTLLNAPYPLPLMPLPLNDKGVSQNNEVRPTLAQQDPAVGVGAPDAWDDFTLKDRKGFHWVFRGPHDGVNTSKRLLMQYRYVSRAGFFLPKADGQGVEIAEGTILPFLLPLSGGTPQGDPVTGTPLTIEFVPAWPAQAPELRVGETLTLPKFGLPQVRGQKSAEVFYEQSKALATDKPSVQLHDPTREKTSSLEAVGLDTLPTSIATTTQLGKTYFQRLAPDLQKRVYFDPLRGPKGSLVLVGEFHDEVAGEDYLDLNKLTTTQVAALHSLCTEGGSIEARWRTAINGLTTRVETFREDPNRRGTYEVGSAQSVRGDELALISNPDTAVDSYAVSATGEGAGWVTLVFGNGRAFTPIGDPVQIKVFRVVPTLYSGELKVMTSSNPLDEQVALRHTGDFAGRPEDYEFEWRWAPGSATEPATYATSWQRRLGGPSTQWQMVRNPAGALPTTAEYAAATTVGLPRNETIHNAAYDLDGGRPGLVFKPTTSVDFTTGGVPGEIVLSASLGDLDGFVLYVNGTAALAYQAAAPVPASDPSAGLVPGNPLTRQFRVPRQYFTAGPNTVEIAVFTGADPGVLSAVDFRLDATQEVDVVASTFQSVSDPNGKNTNLALISGDTALPFGGPTFVLNDRWYTMRYRPKTGSTNVAGTGFSRWTRPQFVEGWIKRVLREINPFEQRVKDLFNNAVSTDTSVLTQAGTRWEGDVALTLDNIESVGLIAIYETVLNRARSMSIDANTNDPDTNNALMLAAGYLNDLYVLFGNEAFADAANPTIATDDEGETTEINTSRFSFENQVASSLDEELALLRGRDDSSTRIDVSPAYNRLYWNYTGGINGGEAIYATNYNIKEKAGSSSADGVIDAADAQRMYPQGHGDAWGHYLTALKGYYRLLANPNFSWQRRAEAVLVLGQAVTVDFVDERKLAASAALLARTAEQTCALVHRQAYQDSAAAGWEHYRDDDASRAWGLDETVSRSAQGAYYNWAMANALLPAEDTYNTGVEKIDRTTVPELNELAASLTSLQGRADSASGRLNPLGLSPGAIPFDIDPTFLLVGSTAQIGNRPVQGLGHFGQIYERALKTLVNAEGSFKQASRMTRLLRSQENQVDDYNTAIVEQERAYRNELIEIFGRPYEGDVGPGKTFAQGYYGPDLHQWFVVDRPNDLVNTTDADRAVLRVLKPTAVDDFTDATIEDIQNQLDTQTIDVEVVANPNQFIQYSDVWRENLGTRPETGELQDALLDAHRSFLELKDALYEVTVLKRRFQREGGLLLEAIEAHQAHLDDQSSTRDGIIVTMTVQKTMEAVAAGLELDAEISEQLATGAMEFLPKVLGTASDVTAPARGSVKLASTTIWLVDRILAFITGTAASYLDIAVAGEEMALERRLDALGFGLEERQQAWEFEQLYRDLSTQEYALAHPLAAYQAANERVRNVLARGLRVLEEREAFRKRAAAVIQGYRTKDVTFRVFRNEALEQYRSLFDLASRYTYIAAKSYDYETGLLGTTQGRAVIDGIVASRSLGDVNEGNVQATTSTLGDQGLAGILARLNADYAVALGRLGVNNPDINGTLFSLRGELFRIRDDPNQSGDDDAWRQTLESHFRANLLADADVATWCLNIAKPDGTPVPGLVIPFSTTIQHGLNFFGLPLAAGDHAFTASAFSTKINSVGVALPGYVGLDEYTSGQPNSGVPALDNPLALSATPYIYLIPTGTDYLRAPAFGDQNTIRAWQVEDQAMPLPFNLGASAFNSTQFFGADGTLTERPWILRKHQAFRPVSDIGVFASETPPEFTSRRLVGRSAWNSGWKLVIPAYTLLNNEQEGLNRFAATVRDIRLFLSTYSYSGN